MQFSAVHKRIRPRTHLYDLARGRLAEPVVALAGANGPVKLALAGNTTGKASLPAIAGSALGVASTRAWGSSLIALVNVLSKKLSAM